MSNFKLIRYDKQWYRLEDEGNNFLTILKPLNRDEKLENNIYKTAWYILWGEDSKLGPFSTLREARKKAEKVLKSMS